MKVGDRVKIDFIGESATIYSGKRFTGYGVLDRVEDGRVFGRWMMERRSCVCVLMWRLFH
jgi:hypothetical protein